jgi:hypothetical protein
MIFGNKGLLTMDKLVRLIILLAVLAFIFYLLNKIVFAGDLFIGMFEVP